MSKTEEATDRLFLLDTMSLAFQAFYGVRRLTNAEGVPTNMVFGFLLKLNQIVDLYHPTHLVAALESRTKTFRHEMFPDYKGHREAPPEEFEQQIPYLLKCLDILGIPAIWRDGYEADDVVAALATKAVEHDMDAMIVSADKDLFQLVSDRIHVLRPGSKDMSENDPALVVEKMGVPPEQIVDYLALVGDISDNIPGVPGIGPKTAAQLLQQFDSLEAVIAGVDEIKSKSQRQKISDNVEQARLSYRLARIAVENVPVDDVDIDDLAWSAAFETPEAQAFFQEMNFRRFLKKDTPETSPPAPVVSEEVATDYRIATADDLAVIAEAARKAGRLAIDTETTALDTMRAGLVGISIATEPGVAWYIPTGHSLGGDPARNVPLETVAGALGQVLADENIAKIAQNAKFDMRMLARHGLPLGGVRFDPMLASYLLDADNSHGLKNMAFRVLGIRMTEIDELIGKGRNAITMDAVEIDRAAPYACADADMTLRLADAFGPQLDEAGLRELFDTMEMPLVGVLDAMEAEGVTLDTKFLSQLNDELNKGLSALSQEICEIAGHPFNIKSTKQVAEVLFEEIGLKVVKKTRTGPSTDSDVLEELAKSHPLPERILEFRHLDKIRSTYVEALPRMVNPETRRVHTTYNQFIAATGRLSSSDPNLQNIPVRTELGRKIRRAFVPNRPGDVFLAADYSQIELRVLAHVTGDKALREAFQTGADIHTETAARVFGMPVEMVTSEMRSQAKAVNFGVLYGMSAHRLSRELGIARSQAQQFIDDYYGAYPAVRRWKDELLEEAHKKGYVETLLGRRRLIRDLDARNRNVRAGAERVAVNTPIQGTSADMIKLAMIALQEEIEDGGWQARMVLQVHDELVFSIPHGEVEKFTPLVREKMIEAIELEVPLVVDVKVGATWADC